MASRSTDHHSDQRQTQGAEKAGDARREGGSTSPRNEDSSASAPRSSASAHSQERPESAGTDRRAQSVAETARTVARGTSDVADSAREVGRAGADAAGRTTEAIAGALSSATNSWAEQVNRMTGLGNQDTREAFDRAARDLRIVARCGSVMVERTQPILSEMLSYSQRAAQTQFDALNRIARARTPVELFAAQSELLRSEMELWFKASRHLGELTQQLGQQIEQLVHAEESGRDRA